MARDYRVGFYFVDTNDTFEGWTRQEVEQYIGHVFEEERYGIRPRHTKAARTDYYYWSLGSPENNPSLPEEIFEERFLGME